MSLHPIIKDVPTKRWCGPSALATVTGRPFSYLLPLLRAIRNGRPVMGVATCELAKAFEQLGYRVESGTASRDPVTKAWLPARRRPTLARWLDENRELYREHAVVIVCSHHYVTVKGRSFCDSWTGKPVPIGSAPWRRARVESWMRVVKVGEATYVPPQPVKRDYEAEKRRAGVLPLAARLGISVEQHVFPGEWWVYPPAGFKGEDVYEMEGHLAYNADDRAERIRYYAQQIEV